MNIGSKVALGISWALLVANAQNLKTAQTPGIAPYNLNTIAVTKASEKNASATSLRAACTNSILLSNPDLFPIDSTTIYLSGGTGAWGFVTGHNNYTDSAKVEKFNITALGIDTFKLQAITSLIYWGANGTPDTDPEIGVIVVASDQTTVLHYEAIDLNNPPANVMLSNLQGNFYRFTYMLPSPIAITGDFFAGLTFSYVGNVDTVGIMSVTLNDNAHNIAGDNTAYEIWNDGTFQDIQLAWGFNFPFNIHIYVLGDAVVNSPVTDSFAATPQTLCYDTLKDTQVVAKPEVYAGHIYSVQIIFNKNDGTADTTLTTAVDFEGYAITIDTLENGDNIVFNFNSVCGGPYTVTITDTCPTIISAPMPTSPLSNIKIWTAPDKVFISSPEEVTVSLYSVDGKEIKTMTVAGTKSIKINTTGTYILKISNGEALKILKIQVK